MTRILVAVIVAFGFGTSAHAAPVTFVDVQYETTAVASAQGVADVQSATRPPSALPLLSEALAEGSTDIASAAAFASDGLFTAATDVTSVTEFATAVAVSTFMGTIEGEGRYRLFVDFDALGFDVGTGSGAVTLFVTLTRNGTTLLDEVFTEATSLEYWFGQSGDASSLLTLMLVSESQAIGADGAAAYLGLVGFRAEVPLLPTHAFLLLAIGIGALTAKKRTRVAP